MLAFSTCAAASTSLTPAQSKLSPLTSAALGSIGEQKIAILLVSFPSVPLLSSATPEIFHSAYFGTGRSVDTFLRELSYGKTWATGQVFGPFVLDADYFKQPLAVRDAAVRAASGHVDLTKFNRIVLVVPQSSTGLESGGLGSIASEAIPLYPSGSVTASTTWLGDASSGSTSALLNAACHEMGHNLGLGHARAADFGGEALGSVGQLPAPWDQTRDYGDNFSNMGRGAGHWAAPQKSALGWLQNTVDYKTVEADGSFVLQPYEAAQSTLKAVRIRRGTGNDAWLWLEYRQANAGSFDADLPAGAFNGALIHYEDAGWNDAEIHSNLLRLNSDDQRGLFFGNAPLATGSSWSDPYSNLTIKLDSNLGSGLQVTVSYAPAVNHPVTPASSLVAAPGGVVTLAVAAPAGFAWSAVSTVPWITVTSGVSGIGAGQITLSVAPTSVTSARWGRIVIGQFTAIVTQDGLAGNVTIGPATADFSSVGGVGEIAVAANAADYQWSYASNAPWIQSVFFSRQSTTGSGTLRYIVAQNTSNTVRTGTISIGGKEFSVSQAAGGLQVSQLIWERVTIADAPISRLSMDMAAFTTRGESVLYGGGFDGTLFSDTWTWNGMSWAQKNPANHPRTQSGFAMTYDAARDQVVLFGGFDSSTSSGLSDSTWIWNGADWTELHPQTNPGERANHSMAYNPVSQKIVLFGGNANEADTWEWDGTNWSKKAVAIAPASRDSAAMAYDAARNEIILFGGARDLYTGLPPKFFSDTWAWDGTQWQQIITAASPSPRVSARIEYSPDLGQIVLIGGYGAKDVGTTPPFTYVFDYREETWTWDGSNWTQRFPDVSPEFSYTYGMVYDAVHKGFFAYLGDNLHCADRGPRIYALKPGTGAVLLASYRADIPPAGASGSFSVTAAVPWTATADSWITLSAGTSGTGNGTVNFQISANTSSKPRTGRIVVNDKVFSISQPGTQLDVLTQPTINDALKVLQAVAGPNTLTPAEQIRYDVAPLGSNGSPLGNGVLDAADVILILRRSIGIGSW
jgi:M6 family metalloprotease-like protein